MNKTIFIMRSKREDILGVVGDGVATKLSLPEYMMFCLIRNVILTKIGIYKG